MAMADARLLKTSEVLQECYELYSTGAFKCLRFLVHSIGATQFLYAAFYWKDFSHRETWGGRLKFLTYWNVVLQGVYHSIALVNDIFGSNAINPQPLPIIRNVRDIIFRTIAFPTSHNVSLTFWVLYAFNRNLVFPRQLDTILSAYNRELFLPRALTYFFPMLSFSWLNHIVHSNVAIFTFLDMLTCCRDYPEKRYGIWISSLAMSSYVGWLHIVRNRNGRWPYPFLNVLNMPMRYIMFATIIGLNIACYLYGEYINNIIWAPEFRLNFC